MIVKHYPWQHDTMLPCLRGMPVVIHHGIEFQEAFEYLDEFRLWNTVTDTYVATISVGDGIEYDGKYNYIQTKDDLKLVFNDLNTMKVMDIV